MDNIPKLNEKELESITGGSSDPKCLIACKFCSFTEMYSSYAEAKIACLSYHNVCPKCHKNKLDVV